jgi:uncharacterized protein DUF1761
MGHGGNVAAIVTAAVAAWIFGAVYYGILSNVWLAAQGKTKEQCRIENTGKSTLIKIGPFILSFIGELAMAWALYGILFHINMFTVRAGAISGAAIWLGFVLTTVVINNAYTGRKLMLTVIDAVHWLGALAIIGAILGWFGP